jgi:hypothetical protein
MVLAKMCSRCLRLGVVKGRILAVPSQANQFLQFPTSVGLVRPQDRRMSWLSSIFTTNRSEQNPAADPIPQASSSENPSPRTPEVILAESLQETSDNRQSIGERKHNEERLVAWGESDAIDESTSPPFVDPLGHLTFSQQSEYFASLPDTYVETLETRARARESIEKDMFTADPLTYWPLCYSTRPSFSNDRFPQWQEWSSERRTEVMQKYRRYDEYFQGRVKQIFDYYDSDLYRSRLTRKFEIRIREEIEQQSIKARKAVKAAAKKGKASSTSTDEVGTSEAPPLDIVEQRVLRIAIKARNQSLNELWRSHISELSKFEDITEDGVTSAESRRRYRSSVFEAKRAEEANRRKVSQEAIKSRGDAHVEIVDWKAIQSEI